MQIIKGLQNRTRMKFNKLYRAYLQINWYRKKKLLITRKGYCKKCGLCCNTCRLLDKKTNLCKNRELSKQIECASFPLSPLDLKKLGLENKCGYYWEEK